MVKILVQKLTISAIATVLLTTKRQRERREFGQLCGKNSGTVNMTLNNNENINLTSRSAYF